jgi:hypothetical protein
MKECRLDYFLFLESNLWTIIQSEWPIRFVEGNHKLFIITNNRSLFTLLLCRDTLTSQTDWHIAREVFLLHDHRSEHHHAVMVCYIECGPTDSSYFKGKTTTCMRIHKIIIKKFHWLHVWIMSFWLKKFNKYNLLPNTQHPRSKDWE